MRISDWSSDVCSSDLAGEGQFVTHRIMAAGHPRIAFELDLFSSLQAHHQEDGDYGWRKFGAPAARTDHVQMWAVGQATALERSLSMFQSQRGKIGRASCRERGGQGV